MSIRMTCVPMSLETLENRTMLSAAPLAAHHTARPHTLLAPAAVRKLHTSKVSLAATAGDPIFMSYPGITGDATAAGFAGDIQLTGLQFGFTRPVGTGGSGRAVGRPTFSGMTITKLLDKASPQLFQDALTGQAKDVKIFLTKPTGGRLVTYAQYEMPDAIATGYQVNSTADQPTETITLSFSRIQFTFMATNNNGTSTPIRAGWDTIRNRAI